MTRIKRAWTRNLDQMQAWFEQPLEMKWRSWFSWRVTLTTGVPLYLTVRLASALVGAPGWATWVAHVCLCFGFTVWLLQRPRTSEGTA